MYVVPRVVYSPPTARPVVVQLSGGRVVQVPQVYQKPKSAPVVTSPPPQKISDKEKKKEKPKKDKKDKKKTSRRVCSSLFM